MEASGSCKTLMRIYQTVEWQIPEAFNLVVVCKYTKIHCCPQACTIYVKGNYTYRVLFNVVMGIV
jgi:hypothetical protein